MAMDKNLLNISAIEDFMYGLLDKNVSKNTFCSSFPSNINSTWTDFVVIDCSTTINDFNARGGGIVSVFLYPAKNKADGSKNVATISSLTKKLNECISNNVNPHYGINRVGSASDYDTTRNLYFDVVLLNINIF